MENSHFNDVSLEAGDELDSIALSVEYPSTHSSIFPGSILRVSGWAAARRGIEKVEIRIDDGESQVATYGLLREDIESSCPGFADVSRSGFVAAFGTSNWGAGEHVVHVSATSKSGARKEDSARFVVEPRSEYEIWAGLQQPTQEELLTLLDDQNSFAYRPRISIVTPVYRTPREFLTRCVDSVKKQAYPRWELILVDDGSKDEALSELLQSFEAQDGRIRVLTLHANQGIAGASNAGLALCSGEYVGFLDHDDELLPHAIYEVVSALNNDRSLDILYTDEDKVDETGRLRYPFFKPGWSPDLLLSMNYVCHFLVVRRSLLSRVGGFRTGFDGSQDYDLILRLSECTARIHRIPKILYRWRIHPDSTGSGVEAKPAASEAGRRAIQDYLGRRQMEAEVLEVDGGRYRVKYKLLGEPEVRIIVPTGGSDTLFTALQTALQKSSYPNFKITVVDNSKGDSVCQVVDKIKANDSRIEVIDCRNIPFNFSYLCNYAAARCESPYLLFLNDDTSVITADWLEAMMEHAQRNEVGAVGAQLLFPNETVQHAGVVMGLQGIAGHAFRGLPPELHYFALSQYIRNCAAVTGACLLTRRNAFEAVKGFDEANLPTCFQDVDLCLRLWERGYRIVYTPYAKLYHYESYSKKVIANRSEMDYMRARWANIIADDPFYNPNLTRVSDDYSLNYGRLFPRVDAAIANQREAGAMHDYEQSEKLKCRVNVRHLGQIDFYAVPNPSPARDGYGQTTLFWNVTGVKKIQIRVGTPAGALFVDGPPSGNASTGSWVEPDTTFYLLDSTKTNTPSADQLLAILVVSVLPADQPQSQTMVRHI